ncbi:MAG: hypothetical protein LJE96_21440 [Deltaproteobacteria bacterium]|nr:hypothetical protein [Deltaproteobacteria bacterium]
MTDSNNTENRVRSYFKVKRNQILALRDLPVCEHSGLIGSHREELQRIYLKEILPKRFEIDRGMVYGPMGRSKESDIVIWDASNYPHLLMLDHSFFFSESVYCVLECKSNWNSDEFRDVLRKSEAVRNIISYFEPGFIDEIQMLKADVISLKEGIEHHGQLITSPHIGTAAIFLDGGQTFANNFLDHTDMKNIDDSWPDILLLLEPGYVVIKRYEADPGSIGGKGWLELYDVKEDSLLMFTSGLLSLLTEKIVQIETPLNIWKYTSELTKTLPIKTTEFRLSRPVPQTRTIWAHH